MTRRKRLCLLLAVLTLLLALSACGARSKLVLATTGMEPTLDLTLPDTITLPDKGRDTVYKSYVDKAYSMALAAALLDMDADTMQAQLAGRLSYDAQTGYIQYYTPVEELTPGDLSEFPREASEMFQCIKYEDKREVFGLKIHSFSTLDRIKKYDDSDNEENAEKPYSIKVGETKRTINLYAIATTKFQIAV